MSAYKNLTENDFKEGQAIADIFISLDEESKKAIKIYAGALMDKKMLDDRKAS